MSKYYRIIQGNHFEGHWIEPKFPLNQINMESNLRRGLAFEVEEDYAINLKYPAWGTGIFKVEDDGNYECVTENFDSSD